MNVMALLPYMVQNYEDANETCIISAENIAQVEIRIKRVGLCFDVINTQKKFKIDCI